MIISLYHCALRRSHPILRSIDEPSPSKKIIMCCDRDVTSLNSGSYQRPSSLGHLSLTVEFSPSRTNKGHDNVVSMNVRKNPSADLQS